MMALFGRKKKEENLDMQPDMRIPAQSYPNQGYGAYEDYAQDYGQSPQQPYPYPEQYGAEQQLPPAMGAPPPIYPQQADKEKIEEIAEEVVEEKWKEKEKEISKMIEWKDEVAAKITQIDQQIDDLKASFESLHKGILGKISEYDENLTNVGTEIKAMEQVFSKVLPSLTESVNKLQRISDSGVKKK